VGEPRQQLRRLRRHIVPAWWRDAKLGIFVHWTPASVPAFAPTDAEIGELLASEAPDALSHVPYTEWYENSLRFPDSPVARHHAATYGDRPYSDFAADWEQGLELWDPDDWAARLAATGAGYVVFVAKHSDGYCLWPTEVTNPNREGWHSRRDVVGEMAEAVRGAGMRFGVYYCGGWDWTFDDRPVGSMADVLSTVPRGAYPAYADAQVRELIRRYHPSVLWNDVAWPSSAARLWPLLTHYYEQVPDGLVNDRWMPCGPALAFASRTTAVRRLIEVASRRQARNDRGLVPPRPPHFDVRTPEYTSFAHIDPTPWECVRGMDKSFGYNACSRPDDFIAHDELVWLLVDATAKGGNLLLNIGPRGVDAQIPVEQVERLDWLARWMQPNRDALVATRPWVRPGTTTIEGGEVRYTARGDIVFAVVRGVSGHTQTTLPDVGATPTTDVRSLAGDPVPWHATRQGLVLDLAGRQTDREPVVLRLGSVSATPNRGLV
jgi:alpha-L-fucosidase